MVRLFRSNPARAGEAGRGSDFERYDNLPRLSLRPPCPARSALPTSSTGPYGGPPVALFPLLAPSLSAPMYRPTGGPHTRASGLIEDATWDQRRAPGRAPRRRGKGRLCLSPEKSRRPYASQWAFDLRPVHHDTALARRAGRAPGCAAQWCARGSRARAYQRVRNRYAPSDPERQWVRKKMEHGRRPPSAPATAIRRAAAEAKGAPRPPGAGAARDGGAVPEARSGLKRTVHARSGLQGGAA